MTYSTQKDTFEPSLCHDWWDSVYYDFRQIVALMGFENVDMQFSGFWSQGDGASFTGRFGPRKQIVANVKAYAPKDAALHQIAQRVADLQRRNFYQLHGSICRTGHRYSHSHTIAADYVERDDPRGSDYPCAPGSLDDLTAIARDLSDWLYRTLEAEYDWQATDQAGQHCRRFGIEALTVGKEYVAALRALRTAYSERHEARRDDVPLTLTRFWCKGQIARVRALRKQWQRQRQRFHRQLADLRPGRRGYNAKNLPAWREGYAVGADHY